ncbi:hypothetical protein [Falsirhodobacter sp. 20TX0035]|uniref:hypothetical protein n=1 Tax=Falsirhodobacter sp. 20TX0035 TaxID=3022019 RepID=UPI00232B7F94|nr:hypothetical protein [Falsirhodobacter sp. 20TX0035]MDB6453677.1 hypothetical protein [Falsirhodobacter sp. 20TX0035]
MLCTLGIEGERTLLAGAFGGATRWIASDRRTWQAAVLAVAGGALAGCYVWPMILWLLRMEERPQTIAMAAFLAGTLGISGVRALSAVVDARARKMRDA